MINWYIVCSGALAVLIAAAAAAAPPDPAALVDPFIGTGGRVTRPPGSKGRYEDLAPDAPRTFPFGGQTYPGAVVPFGMIAVSPDANDGPLGWAAGYTWYDTTLLGFSHMHTSGNGSGFGHLLLAPSAGPRPAGTVFRFSHAREAAAPGYYRVTLLDEEVDAELTATTHAALHRYRFPPRADATVAIDLAHGLRRWGSLRAAQVTVAGADTLVGSRQAEAGRGPLYFVIRTSRAFAAPSIERNAAGQPTRVTLTFDTRTDPTVLVKVGLAFTTLAAARADLQAELPDWDFERARGAARAAWNQALGKLRVTGGTAAERRIFTSALYHAELAPFTFADGQRAYLGADGRVHQADFVNYTFFSLWDTFRGQHPLLTLVEPARVRDMVKSMLALARENGGTLPVYSVAGGNGFGMVGRHAMPVIADAYAKGLADPADADEAYRLMRENMLRTDHGLGDYAKLGWVAGDHELRAAAQTLEYAIDDHAVAVMAGLLGKKDDAALFARRARQWHNVIDPATGFARGRLADGSWRTPFDPAAVSHYGPDEDFVEANAWQYTFTVPHDVAGLAATLGGRRALSAKLDAMFAAPPRLKGSWSADVSGLWGQYAHGNEQSLHVAYLYDWTGEPWKTQARVRQIAARFYDDGPEGLAGNDDAGALSAWYVWSALGLYPVDPVGGVYAIGSPFFDRTTVDVGGGRTFTVVARGNGPDAWYIQSARLDGKPFDRAWLRHAELVRGGTLELVMGRQPNRRWASAPAAAPPSASDAGAR